MYNIIKNIFQCEALQLSDLHNIKRNLYSAKRKKFPPLPKSAEEVQNKLNNIQLATDREENCILVTAKKFLGAKQIKKC